jgi:phosphotriesterase-related protein
MSERARAVQTVTGPIEPDKLGPTLMHEHVLVDFTPPSRRNEPDSEITLETLWQLNYDWVDVPGIRRLTDAQLAVSEMRRLKQAGGCSVVEVSTPGMVVQPAGLQAVSQASGIQIVMGCGRYLEEFMNAADLERGIDDLTAEFIACVTDGYGETGVKAGIIGEIGCSWPWTEAERRSVRAAVIAQHETGAALSIHPGRDKAAPFEIVGLLRETECDMARTIMCHVERRLFDEASILRLADTGLVIEFDLFGIETSFFAQGHDVDLSSDGVRLGWIRSLIDAGHSERIVVSHDICQRTRMSALGGHGYGHIFRNVVPMMRRRGFADDEIDAILVRNPARLLTLA